MSGWAGVGAAASVPSQRHNRHAPPPCTTSSRMAKPGMKNFSNCSRARRAGNASASRARIRLAGGAATQGRAVNDEGRPLRGENAGDGGEVGEFQPLPGQGYDLPAGSESGGSAGQMAANETVRAGDPRDASAHDKIWLK